MPTQCTQQTLSFQGLAGRRVEAQFDGGHISSDAGALLLREVEHQRQIVSRLAGCFEDYRQAERIEHSVEELVSQRVMGLALGYEDLNDHDRLSLDPLLAAVVGKADPTGASRKRERDQARPLAGKSTLNRLEHAPSAEELEEGSARYHKISHDGEGIARLLVEVFLEAAEQDGSPPEEIVLDLDATDDPVYGEQEGRFFHGYYRHYCYLPLYVVSGEHVLVAKLRPANIDASDGAVEELERVVGQIRARWPEVRIIVRADSGFAREAIMAWCEDAGVDYVFGLARNERLVGLVARPLERVRRKALRRGEPVRQYCELTYRTRTSWSRHRRVVAKAEYLPRGRSPRSNPRFVVTSLPKERFAARALYESLYCARGDMENRIKEQQLGLFADRTSCRTMQANQLRLWLSTFAYTLIAELRRLALRQTELARAQAETIRLTLFKIGALVSVSVRRVAVRMSSAYPYAALFATVLAHLQPSGP